MAGMADNPLIGDYTKGISKGRDYFVALDKRIKREKADPKVIAQDFVFGIFAELDKWSRPSVKVCHSFSAVRERGKFVTVGKSLSDLGNLVKK